MRVIGESDRQIRTRDVGGQRNGLVRAAFTVEAALIMPVILMVILSSLYLCMHVHNRNYLRSYAVEQSISGHEQPDPALLFSSDISASRTDGGNMRIPNGIHHCIRNNKEVFRASLDSRGSWEEVICETITYNANSEFIYCTLFLKQVQYIHRFLSVIIREVNPT